MNTNMFQHLLIALVLAGTLFLAPAAAPASAQDKPTAKPAAKPAADASAAASAPSAAMGNMLGGGDTNTTFDGNYELEYDQTTNQLAHLRITKGVQVRSDKLNLDCELLVYDAQAGAGHMVATGEIDKPVHLKQDTVTATCQKLEYFPDDGKSILTGKPVVRQIGPGGNVMETRGSKVTIIQTEGRVHVLVDADKGPGGVGGSVTSTGNTPAATPAGQGAEITVPLTAVGGSATGATKPKATPASTPKGPAAPTLMNAPQPTPASSGRRAPAVSQ